MANAKQATPVTTAEQEPEDGLTCAVCHDVYKVPKLLECTHTFCEQCLVDYVGQAMKFCCPMCRKDIRVPPGGVAAFRNNPYIRSEDLEMARRTYLCRHHPKKELELYCMQCDLPVCVLCMMKEHIHHDIKTISEAAENVLDQLNEDQNRIDQAVDDVAKHVLEARGKLENLQEKKSLVEKDIRNRHITLLAAADKLRDEALNSLESVSQEIEDKLHSELSQIQANLKQLQMLKRTLDEAAADGVDYERVTVAKDMRCGAGSSDLVQQMARQRIGTVTRPVLRCGEADHTSVVGKMGEFVGVVVRLERRESLASGKRPCSVLARKKCATEMV